MEEDATLSFLLSSAAERFCGRPAIDFVGGSNFSFGELDDLASRFAAGLVKLGVWPGERVVLCLPNCWQWVIAYHGVIKLGAVIVPTNPLLTIPELQYIVDDTEATAVVVPGTRVEGLQYQGARIISTDDDVGTVLSFAATLDSGAFCGRAAKPEDIVTIGYTSGTTGKPKGAMLTHGNIASCISGTVARHKRQPGILSTRRSHFPMSTETSFSTRSSPRALSSSPRSVLNPMKRSLTSRHSKSRFLRACPRCIIRCSTNQRSRMPMSAR